MTAPSSPLHLFAQQMLALCLQERRLPFDAWPSWIGRHAGFAAATAEEREAILGFMLERQFMFGADGEWSVGDEAERQFGWRHFLELVSAFTAESLFTVMHGDVELGSVHQLTFALKGDEGVVLLLGGRPWALRHVDWTARVAFVVPTQVPGKSRWLGDGVPLGFDVCRMIARVLAGDVTVPAHALTRRATAALGEAREEYAWLDPNVTVLRSRDDGRVEWATFAGLLANGCLAASLAGDGVAVRRYDNFSMTFADAGIAEVAASIERLRTGALPIVPPAVNDEALDGLKFSACVPPHIARRVLASRALDPRAVAWVASVAVRTVASGCP